MDYETYRYIFIIGAIMAMIMFIVSIIIFFVLHIPKVIGGLSGITAKKAIGKIKYENDNAEQGIKNVNSSRVKLTDKITSSGRVVNPRQDYADTIINTVTAKIESNNMFDNSINQKQEQYNYNEQAVMYNETQLLDEVEFPTNETTVLNQTSNFHIDYDIKIVHTNEFIS